MFGLRPRNARDRVGRRGKVLTIYHVDAEDLMNSVMSSSRDTIGYFLHLKDAEAAKEAYNKRLSPRLKASSFKAIITKIEVNE